MIYKNKKLSSYNWFNLGGPAKLFFKPSSLEDLQKFLKENSEKEKIFILGVDQTLFSEIQVIMGL